METMGERIKKLRKAKDLTQEELGDKVGLKRAAINKYETGNVENIKRSTIEKMSKIFRVTPTYLMALDENDHLLPGNYIKVPILGTITCFKNLTAIENIEDYKFISSENLPNGNLFYLYAKDDSMKPLINDGDLVLMKEQSDAENDDIVGIILDNSHEITIRRIKKKDNIILLMSDNINYDPIIIDENSNAKIIGKAIEVASKL